MQKDGKEIGRSRDFICFILKRKRKDKPTFRTMVNFDEALHDPNHVIQIQNERRALSPPPSINSAVEIETETVDRELLTMFWIWVHYIAIH